MQTEPITIHVSVRAARAFRNASPATQRQILDFLEFALLDEEDLGEAAFGTASDDLKRTMEEMGKMARERGLTDEKLAEILNDLI